MLTRVTVGQVRFNLGGLTADARGVATGKELLLRFATLDRLVGFVRLASAERAPEEVWSSFKILYARPAGGAREVLARLVHPGSDAGDRVAATARLAGGQPYTGTGRHFVPTRDTRAPLGFDVASVPADEGDFCLITPEGAVAFRQEGTLAFERLLLRLELRRRPGGAQAAWLDHGGEVIVSVRRGLAPLFMQLLSREGIRATAATLEGKADGPFEAAAWSSSWLFQVDQLPSRLGDLCASTPGFALYLPVLPDVFVAAGWEHPVHLTGVKEALSGQRLLLLSPPPGEPIAVAPPPRFVAIEDLLPISLAGLAGPIPLSATRPSEALSVPLRLVTVPAGPVRVRGVLTSWAQAHWLRRLLFSLPSVVLRDCRVAFVEAGVLILGGDRSDQMPFGQIPFGQPLVEAQDRLFVPVGMSLRPQLSPDLLASHLGIGDGNICVFPAPDVPPFRVAPTAFEALERRALGRVDVPWATPPSNSLGPSLAAESTAAPEIENESLGLLPLWGWRP